MPAKTNTGGSLGENVLLPPPSPQMPVQGLQEVKAKPKAKGPRGRKKTKDQISVRIDQAILDLTRSYVNANGLQIVDLIEDGLHLVLKERFHEPADTTKARFLLKHCSTDLLRLTVGFWALLSIPPTEFETADPLVRMLGDEQKRLDQYLRRFLETPWYERGLEIVRRQRQVRS